LKILTDFIWACCSFLANWLLHSNHSWIRFNVYVCECTFLYALFDQ